MIHTTSTGNWSWATARLLASVAVLLLACWTVAFATEVSGSGTGDTQETALNAAKLDAVETEVLRLVGTSAAIQHLAAIEQRVYDRYGDFVGVTASARYETREGRVHVTVPLRVKTSDLERALLAAGVPLLDKTKKVEPVKRPPFGPLTNRVLRIKDRTVVSAGLNHGDVEEMAVGLDGKDAVFQVRVVRPIPDGMFLKAECWFNCDDSPTTGISGYDLRTRASVGSRFRPNAFEPPEGAAWPLTLTRASTLLPVETNLVQAGGRGHEWQNTDALARTQVSGRILRWRVPFGLFDRGVSRYTETPIRFRMFVTATCSDHPLTTVYDCLGDGRKIELDGKLDDWSGGPHTEDPGGELHPDVGYLDLRGLWCEHSEDRLYLRIDFDKPGFSRRLSGRGDLTIRDGVNVIVHPVGEEYMAPLQMWIPAGSHSFGKGDWRCFVTDGHMELSVRRPKEQTHFRVAVWSEAWRRDEVGEEYSNLFRLRRKK